MASNPPSRRRVHFTDPSQRDYKAILQWTETEFGAAAVDRYRALIRQAVLDLRQDPERAGSRRQKGLAPGARIYHLSNSRDRVSGTRVQSPRHFLLYRLRPDGVLEIGRILHDQFDLIRHFPREYLR